MELLEQRENENNQMDMNQRKSVWKRSYQMKNEMNLKPKKDDLIDNKLMPEIKQIMETNFVMCQAQVNKNIAMMDKFENMGQPQLESVQKIKDHNQQLRDKIFAMDEHIKQMNTNLEVLE